MGSKAGSVGSWYGPLILGSSHYAEYTSRKILQAQATRKQEGAHVKGTWLGVRT